MPPFYITTPIYYVNDKPHLGHAYTTVAADVVSRYWRATGRRVHFQTGVDEHGQKVQQAAEKRGIAPQQHCDEMHLNFVQLWERLGIQYDGYIRTTSAPHVKIVQDILQALYDKGEIYTRSYEGWYSTYAERFYTKTEAPEGKDPETGRPLDWIEESNYFFKMGARRDWLRQYILDHPEFIQPATRRNEVLGFLERPLDDLCISRPKHRLAWGIELPFDRDFVTYVWFDALINYISAIGYGADPARFQTFWPATHHLVGKDIITTHAVYWSTMLHAMGLELPRNIFAHGWWTVEGQKMSKSLGNAVDPNALITEYGADALRYFLLREMPLGQDGDFSHKAMVGRYNSDLGNDLGNGLNRAVSMTHKYFGGVVPAPGEIAPGDKEITDLKSLRADVHAGFEALAFHKVLDAIWGYIRFINKYIDREAPWALARAGKAARNATVLYNALEAVRAAAVLIEPFMPTAARQLAAQLGAGPADGGGALAHATLDTWGWLKPGTALPKPEPVFPRIEPDRAEAILARLAGQPTGAPMPAAGKASQTGAKEAAATSDAAPAKAKKREIPPPAASVAYDEFARIDLRVAEIIAAERVPKSEKLVRLTVNAGDPEPRTVVAGIGQAFAPEALIGRRVAIVANLAPAKLMGIESHGMVLAAGPGGAELVLTSVDAPPGTRIK